MENKLTDFLNFGYYLDYESKFSLMPQEIDIDKNDDVFFSENLKTALTSSIEKSILPNKKVVIPISGGYDSRLILSILLEFFPANDIYTYTFGVPKSYDFEIGSFISKKIGTKHVSFNLQHSPLNIENLVYNNKKISGQCFLFYSTPFHLIDNEFGDDALYFSGFMGDPLAGSKLKNVNTIDEAKKKFFLENKVTSFKLNDNFSESLSYKKNLSLLTPYENIDFYNRQAKYIMPHVAPDTNYLTPFLDERVVNLFFSLSLAERKNCEFYKKFCHREFTNNFSLPLKDFHGGSINTNKVIINLSKGLNHLFSKAPLSRGRYLDKRVNYFSLVRKLSSDKAFSDIFKSLYYAGVDEIVASGSLKDFDFDGNFKNGRNDLDKIIIASIGVQGI